MNDQHPAIARLLTPSAASRKPVIALAEGTTSRIIQGAVAAHAEGLADIILVGPTEDVTNALSAHGAQITDGISIQDPDTSPAFAQMVETLYHLRKHKGMTQDAAARFARQPLIFAALLVKIGLADTTLAGAVSSTTDVVRAALQVIGKAPEADLVSSFFLMIPPADAPPPARPMIYADCGLVIKPSIQEHVQIAAASCRSHEALLGEPARLAFLSFSTKGSAHHDAVDAVTQAADAFGVAYPDVISDGELQFDAAFLPEVAERKAPGSHTAGLANVLIFPSLNAGNIAYKITQRLGGYTAIGPILQGLAQPANDLSRGCSSEDVKLMIAVASKQVISMDRPFTFNPNPPIDVHN